MSALCHLHVLAEQSGPLIAETWADRPEYSVKVHSDLEGLLQSGIGASDAVMIIEVSGTLDVMETLATIRKTAPNAAGVLLSTALPISAVQMLLSLQNWAVLECPATLDDLETAIAEVRAKSVAPVQAQPVESGSQGKCWAFVSPVGGGGASLLSVEAAYQISQQSPKPKTCLIDLNFFDGSCAQFLDCDSNLKLEAMAASPEQMDDVFLKAMTTTHRSGLDLIAAPRTPDPSLYPSREATLRCLEVACDVYEYVVVDMPRWPMPWTSDLVAGADEVFLISELTVPALNSARRWIQDFDQTAIPRQSKVKTILNRRQKGLFGTKLTIEQAEKAIQQRVFGSIQSDWPGAMASVNLGQPVSVAKPGSVIAKDIAMLLKHFETQADAAPSTKQVA